MLQQMVYGILGGDKRQIYLARAMASDGLDVRISCLERGEGTDTLEQVGHEKLIADCDVILLPLPVTKDGKTLNTPLSEVQIPLDDNFAVLFSGKRVYGGMMEKLLKTSSLWDSVSAFDYYVREELLVGNAVLTAEGAIGMAIQEYEGALNSSRILVTGFGRIGKALCLSLKGLGAQVDCAARKAADLTAIRALGCTPVRYEEIRDAYDVIFNTVPAQVLTAQRLSCQRPDTLLIELASQPGGMDLEAAHRLGLRVCDGPSLPGRMSPRAAGELIRDTIYHMIQEA